MQVAVSFGDERLALEVPDDRLVARWEGPAGSPSADVERLVAEALEHPRDYPPLRQAVVPGDRVVIAFDAEVPEPRAVLEAICRTLKGVGIDAAWITVLASGGGMGLSDRVPEGVAPAVHDPGDRSQLAYLASTAQGRRVYLNRLLTDADFVLPVGRLGYEPGLGYRGPWSTIFPGLSDLETQRDLRGGGTAARPDRERPSPALEESSEVSWLLGSQLQLGIVAGVGGPAEVVAGLEATVRSRGGEAVDRAWTFRTPSRAELVVAGIGRAGVPTGIRDLAEGLATAAGLVQRGGKIVALSRAEGPIGPSLRRLIDAGDPRAGVEALRGHEADPDYPAALSLARTLAWADVYLFSGLGRDDVEDLSMIALDRVEEARRLVRAGGSCLVVSQAELTRPDVADES